MKFINLLTVFPEASNFNKPTNANTHIIIIESLFLQFDRHCGCLLRVKTGLVFEISKFRQIFNTPMISCGGSYPRDIHYEPPCDLERILLPTFDPTKDQRHYKADMGHF